MALGGLKTSTFTKRLLITLVQRYLHTQAGEWLQDENCGSKCSHMLINSISDLRFNLDLLHLNLSYRYFQHVTEVLTPVLHRLVRENGKGI